jgi:hypothetical protein
MAACRPFSNQAARLTTIRSKLTAPSAHIARQVRSMALISGDTFFLDEFALRQWDDPNYGGTRISHDKADFVARVHAAYKAGAPLHDGYAPFCKVRRG